MTLFRSILASILVFARAEAAPLPDTSAGRLAKGWLELCAKPDRDQFQHWLENTLTEAGAKRKSPADRAQDAVEACRGNGGFRDLTVSGADDHSLKLAMQGAGTGFWYELAVATDGAGKAERIGVHLDKPPEDRLPKDLSDKALARHLSDLVAKATASGQFSGIAVVARGTRTIAAAAGGMADRDRKTAITGSSRFTLASLGKLFTTVAIGQLVDQHKVAFDDVVGRFFPDYPNPTVRDKVTVAMLLSHRAGLGDFIGKRPPGMLAAGVKRADEYMPLYENDELQFAPGTSFGYSNAGLALAGAIVEKVSGEDYPDYVRNHIFVPAGMTDSDPNNRPHRNRRMVTPYTQLDADDHRTDWHEARREIGSPAGGAISTADDLVKFAAALRDGKLVNPATLQELFRNHPELPGPADYGYTMVIEDYYGQTVAGHNGGCPGVNTELHWVLDSPYVSVVLSNIDAPSAEKVTKTLVAYLAEKARRDQLQR